MALRVFFSCSTKQCDIIKEKREIFESQGSINVLDEGFRSEYFLTKKVLVAVYWLTKSKHAAVLFCFLFL